MTDQFYNFRFKWTDTAAIGIHPTKVWLSQLVNFKNATWTWGHFRRMICNKILFSTWIKCNIYMYIYIYIYVCVCVSVSVCLILTQKQCMECFRLLLEHLAWIEYQSLSGIRDWKNGREYMRDDVRCDKRKEVNALELIGERVRVRVRVTMLRF